MLNTVMLDFALTFVVSTHTHTTHLCIVLLNNRAVLMYLL